MYINNTTNNNISYTALPKKYKVVDNYLIRGPHPNISDIFQLKKEGINQIYDFRHYGLNGFKWVERLACKAVGIEYIRKPYSFIEHMYPTLEEYETISKAVKENGEKGGMALFHCNSGTHRTSLMAAFFKITKGKPLEECKNNENFNEIVNDAVEEEITNSRFFSRNKVDTNTKNPLKLMKNTFNNKVEEVTRKAYDMFMDMMKKDV